MATIETTGENFERIIGDHDIVLVDFWAEWCAPCRMFAPVYEAASQKHADLVFAKIDTEKEQELAAAFSIESIPTLMVFRESVLVFQQAGALPGKVLDELIGKVRGLDMAEIHKEIAKHEAEHANCDHNHCGHGHCDHGHSDHDHGHAHGHHHHHDHDDKEPN